MFILCRFSPCLILQNSLQNTSSQGKRATAVPVAAKNGLDLLKEHLTAEHTQKRKDNRNSKANKKGFNQQPHETGEFERSRFFQEGNSSSHWRTPFQTPRSLYTEEGKRGKEKGGVARTFCHFRLSPFHKFKWKVSGFQQKVFKRTALPAMTSKRCYKTKGLEWYHLAELCKFFSLVFQTS